MGGCCSSKGGVQKTNLTADEKQGNIAAAAEELSSDCQFMETLQEIPLLSTVSKADQIKLAKRLVEKEFKKGDNLMVQGDAGKEFFMIATGKCQVIVLNDSGEEVEIAQLVEGDYCGEQALLKDATRGATIRAMCDTKCFVLDQEAFQEIANKNNIRFANRDAKRNAISAERVKARKNIVDGDGAKAVGGDDEKESGDKPVGDGKDKEHASEETVQWLLKCVADNILFSHLDSEQRLVVCSEMYKVTVAKDECLINQGEEGNTFYVVEEGEFVITVKDVGQVDTLKKGRCVGELALLYNAPRAATVQCSEGPAVVWCVDRGSFRKALMEVHTASTDENLRVLKKCELLAPLLSSELELIDQALEMKVFAENECIFKMGDEGDRFYVVKSGEVAGEAKDGTTFELTMGGFFGERALLTNEPRAATLTAKTKEVECLTLTKEDFDLLLGPLDDIMKRNLEEYEKPDDERKPIGHKKVSVEKSDDDCNCELADLETIGILGRGAFGTVSLVKDPATGKSYALKAIRKNQVVEMGQQSHILNEKKVMTMLDNPFLVNLRATYKDEYRLYFLLEACLGGELFTILRKLRSFDEPTARFYSSCVVEAFDYMHQRDIIYRDLKPENLVLTDTGYLKVTDFGFAKVVSNKTFTLCGTPDYLAPEIVTGQGHGKGVDWWTLGILIYEMLASFPPFFDDEPMMTYRKIIQGKFKYPRYLSAQSKDLISKLLKPKSTKRIGVIKGGVDLIRNHAWFADFSWDELRNLTLNPPIKNKVKSPTDLSNFDHFTAKKEDVSYKGDADLGWDNDF